MRVTQTYCMNIRKTLSDACINIHGNSARTAYLHAKAHTDANTRVSDSPYITLTVSGLRPAHP